MELDTTFTPRQDEKWKYRKRTIYGTFVRCVETNRLYRSIRDAARAYGIGEDAISQCCRGVQKTAGGLHWEYYADRPETLCWTCRNCYGGCSWTEWDQETGTPRFAPVEGWTARRELRFYGGTVDFSFHVLGCPLYVQDESR